MLDMDIVLFLMHLLDVIFFVGLAGSSIVVIYSFIEDTMELFDKNEPPVVQSAPPASPGASPGIPARS